MRTSYETRMPILNHYVFNPQNPLIGMNEGFTGISA